MQHQTLVLPRLILAIAIAMFSSVASAQSQAVLESPAAGAFVQSGVGLIRGWACAAQRIEFSIDGGAAQAIAYGTERLDTQPVCGDSDNGFGFTQNWGELGDGVHNLRAFADGVAFADVNFTVTTLGRAYLTGLVAQYTLQDFPNVGDTPQVRWSEPLQNFVFAHQIAISANNPPSALSGVKLEAPSQGSHESGIGLIRGWACEASSIEISIDGGTHQAIAYGSDRPDTESTCGDRNNGFGFTQNWSEVGDGTHNLRAYRDGVEFANVNFAVATVNRETYLTGLSRQFKFADFPETGQTTTAQWSESNQNFIVSRTTATPSRLALIAAITDVLNPMAVAGKSSDTASGESTGVRADKRSDGQLTRLTGLTWANVSNGQSTDLQLAENGLPAVYTDSNGTEAQLTNFDPAAGTMTVSFSRNDTAQGNPVTVPLDGGRLGALQTMAERVRQALMGTSAESGHQLVSLDAAARETQATASRFSLSALLVNSYWYGSVAAGETLCAIRTAAAQAGLSGVVATDACQAPLLSTLLTQASTRSNKESSESPIGEMIAPPPSSSTPTLSTRLTKAATEPPASGIDPLVQKALQADADIPEAPCGSTSDSASCLEPTTNELRARQIADTQTPALPHEEPPSELPIRSYTGKSTMCFSVTANYGTHQACPKRCSGGDASATLQNESLTLKITGFSFPYNFDYDGNCIEATLIRSGEFSPSTGTAVNGRLSYSYQIYIGDSPAATVNMQGVYSDTSLSASGSARYDYEIQDERGSVTFNFTEEVTMESSSP